jgi:hypothetical protein
VAHDDLLARMRAKQDEESDDGFETVIEDNEYSRDHGEEGVDVHVAEV